MLTCSHTYKDVDRFCKGKNYPGKNVPIVNLTNNLPAIKRLVFDLKKPNIAVPIYTLL